ncbi:hypothetical protein RHS01_05693 [Rhizoctonia solani]|uniref:Uncharacterized protein n=1 Tax=Rhizoctonia solani TaxID=456999 RepID=A0A8H7ID71_9AGAM|nr:hypothetical protein RHS01_05693 [Rhizoctonia solani]
MGVEKNGGSTWVASKELSSESENRQVIHLVSGPGSRLSVLSATLVGFAMSGAYGTWRLSGQVAMICRQECPNLPEVPIVTCFFDSNIPVQLMVASINSHAGSSDDEYPNLDAKAFARMIEKNIGLGEPTEIEERVLNEAAFYRQPTDTPAARQASQTIYTVLLPKKIQEIKDEEIFQNFRPPTAGLDDPMLTAPAKNDDPFSALAVQTNFQKTSVARGLSAPRDTTAASVQLFLFTSS